MVLWGRGCRAASPALCSPVANSFAPKHLHVPVSIWLVQNLSWQPQNVPRGTGSLAPSPLQVPGNSQRDHYHISAWADSEERVQIPWRSRGLCKSPAEELLMTAGMCCALRSPGKRGRAPGETPLQQS